MQENESIKRTKLAALAIVAAVICAYIPWRNAGASAGQDQPRRRPEIVGVGVPFNERFGAGDGAAFVVHFSGDIHGGLEPCG